MGGMHRTQFIEKKKNKRVVPQPPKPGPSAALSSTNDLGNATQHDARVPSSAPGWLPVCPRGNFACARLAEHQQRTARAALHRAAVERRFGRSGPEVRVALPFHDGVRVGDLKTEHQLFAKGASAPNDPSPASDTASGIKIAVSSSLRWPWASRPRLAIGLDGLHPRE